MKLFKTTTVLLLFTSLLFTACKGKSGKDFIANKWKMTNISGEGAKDMSEDEKKSMASSIVMDLTKDGKINMTGMGESAKTGTWKLSDDAKTLFLTHDGEDKAEPQEVNELTAEKLVITDPKSKLVLSFSSK